MLLTLIDEQRTSEQTYQMATTLKWSEYFWRFVMKLFLTSCLLRLIPAGPPVHILEAQAAIAALCLHCQEKGERKLNKCSP
jgi:hypothetical protein